MLTIFSTEESILINLTDLQEHQVKDCRLDFSDDSLLLFRCRKGSGGIAANLVSPLEG